MPQVARAQGQVCAQHPTTANPTRQQGLDAYEAQSRERKVTTMTKQAKALGYTLVPLPAQG